MVRHICLDTETTGINPRAGHRIIEIACVELENALPTGQFFHCYINPERDIDPEAEKIHGLSRAFLEKNPRFEDTEVCDAFLDFIGDSPLIAHNAAFDKGFVDAELERLQKPLISEERWICTLIMARKKFPGSHNSLDALCKRFQISLADREKHGALVDTKLLSQVYLELCGGREQVLQFTSPHDASKIFAAKNGDESLLENTLQVSSSLIRPKPLASRLSPEEAANHKAFVEKNLGNKTLWRFL